MDALEERRRRMNATLQPAWRTEVERPEVPVPRFSGLATEIEPRKAFPFKAIAVVMVLVSLALFGYSWYRDRHTATTPAVQTQTAVPDEYSRSRGGSRFLRRAGGQFRGRGEAAVNIF
jgi:hypothetical protein